MLRKIITVIMAFAVAATAFANSKDKINIAYVKWSSAIASVNVVRVVLEQAGYQVTTTPVPMAIMYQAIAEGQADAMVAAWLPTSGMDYHKKFKNDYVDLGPNLEGTRQGLVVPAYTYESGIRSIADLNQGADRFHNQIVGIESGTGTNRLAKEAIAAYDLKKMRLQASSEVIMLASLKDAIRNHEDIVITGWTPHWVFKRFALKYLEDPKKTYGDTEQIRTIVRKGLKKDSPRAYKLLDNFHWTPENMNELILMNQDKSSNPYDNAKKWIAAHPEIVKQWTQ